MAIRDENMNWKLETRELDRIIMEALEPTFKIAKERGFSMEEWFYLVTTRANDFILDECLNIKRTWKNS